MGQVATSNKLKAGESTGFQKVYQSILRSKESWEMSLLSIKSITAAETGVGISEIAFVDDAIKSGLDAVT